jgi:hypothetical protein
MAGYGASADDTTRFLRELRQLRDSAGLTHAELAARAHYPYDVIRNAELGPGLPDLPVLSAFVRGCGGTTEEWEERWRSLTQSPSLPLSSARQSGRSDAATAGARISSASPAGDGPDPSIIIAALNRVAEEMASPSDDAVPVSPVGQSLPDLPPAPRAEPLSPRGWPGSPDSPSSPGSPAQSGNGGKPAGWDPIRVSSAWPALGNTPPAARGTGSPETTPPWEAAPWETPPWADDPLDAAPAARPGPAGALSPATPAGKAAPGSPAGGSAAGTRAAARAPAPVRARASGSVRLSARTWTVILVVVLICALAVLLAIFA